MTTKRSSIPRMDEDRRFVIHRVISAGHVDAGTISQVPIAAGLNDWLTAAEVTAIFEEVYAGQLEGSIPDHLTFHVETVPFLHDQAHEREGWPLMGPWDG